MLLDDRKPKPRISIDRRFEKQWKCTNDGFMSALGDTPLDAYNNWVRVRAEMRRSIKEMAKCST